MSQENVAIVRRHYEHPQSHDDFLDEVIAPDYVWDMSHFSGWPEQQIYEGIEEARTFHPRLDGCLRRVGDRGRGDP